MNYFTQKKPIIHVKDIISEEDINDNLNNSIPYEKPTHYTSYTIPQGTIMYFASKKIQNFDTDNIEIGSDNFVGFFSPNKEIASGLINHCYLSEDNDNAKGWIHKFEVKNDINNIVLLSPNDKQMNWNKDNINTNICSSTKYGYKPNGVGFFIKSNNLNDINYSQFALCNPSEQLQYIGTYQCISPGILSKESINIKSGY
jgi:hypothetical protein